MGFQRKIQVLHFHDPDSYRGGNLFNLEVGYPFNLILNRGGLSIRKGLKPGLPLHFLFSWLKPTAISCYLKNLFYIKYCRLALADGIKR